ncbi:MAG: HAMP domain-containing protein [Verrucomicrobiaceae bacterium]|nr:MAG: HAMP domain-containing protein [Verrucomicrobiaceae bacterium]
MPNLSFSARLMLAMMLIVTLVTAGALWLMRQRVETSYLRMSEERFRSQIEMFMGMQSVRLESIRERCRMLARSATVVEALQLGSGDLPDGMLRDLKAKARVVRDSATAFDEPTATKPDPPELDNPSKNNSGTELKRRQYRLGPPDFIDLALVSSSGRVQSLKSGAAGNFTPQWLREDRVSFVPREQQTGYLMADTPYRFKMPREVILSPVHEPNTQEILGALAVGLPLSEYGENSLYDLNRPDRPGTISNGIWLENQLFMRTVSIEQPDALGSQVRLAVAKQDAGGPRTVSVRLTLSGTPYQMLLRPLNSNSALPQAWGVMLSSLAGMDAEQKALRNEILGTGALALAAGLFLSYFLSRGLMRPVRALVHGTGRIREGKYDTRVRVMRKDELGTLSESFNEMAEGLQQRERFRSILVQGTDYEVAQRLIESPALGGERRDVSVLFCDIRGFTAVTDGMVPEDIISMLNEHMTVLTECVHKHHGVVDKFVGDLIMAVFGAPESGGDDAGNAARCALEMVERRRTLNTVTAHPLLEVGIGIASGPAVAGCMGSENRLNYTVLGVRVNLASRLCSNAAPGTVLIDSITVHRLELRAVGKLLEEQCFKGFSQPMRPFRLEGMTAEIQPPDEVREPALTGD